MIVVNSDVGEKRSEKVKLVDIENYILDHFSAVHLLDVWGEKSFFLSPGQRLKRGTYFATLKEKDGDHDQASSLDREGVFRLNIGVSKECYLSLFETLPKRPSKGSCIEGEYDFKQLNCLHPHPIYGWMGWISILNPCNESFERCKILLEDGYKNALRRAEKRIASLDRKKEEVSLMSS